MQSLNRSKTTQKVNSKSTVLFSLGAAMFTTTVVMTAVSIQNGISPAVGAIVSSFLTALFFGFGIHQRSRERRA